MRDSVNRSASQEADRLLNLTHALKENDMKHIHRHLGLLLLSATLVAPVLTRAAVTSPDEPRATQNHKRYYDRDHKDYHDWDDRENGAYRRWIEEEKHETYRDFAKMKRAQQQEYWKWRHEHPDNDRDRR